MLKSLYLYYFRHHSCIFSMTCPHKAHVQKLNFELFYMDTALAFASKEVISDSTNSAESTDTFTSTIAHQDDNAPF